MNEGYVDEFLTYWQTINRHLRKGTLSEGGQQITRLQWMMLRHVRTSDNTAIGSIADKFGVRPSTVSQMADRLERAGLVDRVAGVADARQKSLRLTDAGRALISSVESVWAARLVKGLNQFTADEQTELLKLLSRLAASMQVVGGTVEEHTDFNEA